MIEIHRALSIDQDIRKWDRFLPLYQIGRAAERGRCPAPRSASLTVPPNARQICWRSAIRTISI